MRNLLAYLTSRHVPNHDEADLIMALRSRQAKSIGAFIAIGILATMALPFLFQNQTIAGFCLMLSFLMAGGLIAAGLWNAWTLMFLRDVKTDRWVESRQSKAIRALLVAAILAVVMFIFTMVATAIGSASFFSYDALKSLGLFSYIVLGLAPVVAYIFALYAVAVGHVVNNHKWRIASAVCLLVALVSPWVWSGYKLYSDYHHM